MVINFSSNQWQVRGYWPHTPLFGRSMETGVAMGAVTHWMPASVPGCVHNDLLANGVIEDPCYEMNSLKCEWVENRWWVYRTEFVPDESCRGKTLELVFLGVDYKCHIFLNNEVLCEHEGMFEPVRVDISGKARIGAANVLEVVLESPPDEMGQIGRTSMVRTQKSRFGYKWDFCTRLVHTGIWDDVYLEVTPGARIANVHVATSLSGHAGVVDIAMQLMLTAGKPYRVQARLGLGGAAVAVRNIELQPENHDIRFDLPVDNPLLWWPNGHGEQPLYDLEIRLVDGDELCDSHNARVGIRSLAYCQNDGAQNALPYTVVINGKRIYIKGVNMTPLDHGIGSVTAGRYAETLSLARNANVNLIRVWGGGIIEKKAFYDLCDQYGILVWQEFNQSSSGIDNVPPKDINYLELLKKNATAAILRRRNHVSLAYWSGGNELMDAGGVPSTYGDPNIAMLRDLVRRLDPGRQFLPTSASGPSEFLDVSPQGLGRNHDVHGPWQYQGPERHYEMYNRSDSLLHSEFGVEGFTNHSAALRFLSAANREPSNVNDNLVWRHHGEWWDTTGRDRELFGELDNLEQMVMCSQYIQAEGLRYAVESNRRRAFENCGSIIWQFNEPWPNLFCTSLVDYYGRPKAAYWWVKRAYAPLAVSLSYSKLGWKTGELFQGCVWLSGDECAFDGTVTFKITDLDLRVLHEGEMRAAGSDQHSFALGDIQYKVQEVPHGLFFVELSIAGRGDEYRNGYLFSHNDTPIFRHAGSMDGFGKAMQILKNR